MKFLNIAIFSISLLGNAHLLAGISDAELQKQIDTFKEDSLGYIKRCVNIDPEKAKLKTEKHVKDGLLSQAQADLLNRHGLFAAIDDGELVAVCPHGCFAPNTAITVASAENIWEEVAVQALQTNHLVASPANSHFEGGDFHARKVRKAIVSPEAEREHLISFSLENGKVLEVTPGHGMLLADGKMERASQIKVGEHFIGVDGVSVEIKQIENKIVETKVYNFRLEGEQPHDHIMVASQVLVGDHYWQAEGSEDLGAINIRGAAVKK